MAVLAAVLVAACGSTTQSATPKTYTGTLTFASFNPFTGPDASFGPEMDAVARQPQAGSRRKA